MESKKSDHYAKDAPLAPPSPLVYTTNSHTLRVQDERKIRMNAILRNEHPRPDRMRASWMTLNGPWDFAFDPDDAG